MRVTTASFPPLSRKGLFVLIPKLYNLQINCYMGATIKELYPKQDCRRGRKIYLVLDALLLRVGEGEELMTSKPSSFILLRRSICSFSSWIIYSLCVPSRASSSLKAEDNSSRFASSIKARNLLMISFI